MGATVRTVDMSNVKEGGNFNKNRIPSGDYLAKIVKVEDAIASGDKTPQYLFTIQIVSHSATKLPYYCKLQENQLWKLRNILVAAGMSVPKKRINLDPNKVVGKEIGVSMVDDEYDGKDKSVIDAVFPVSELDDYADDQAEPEEDDSTEEADAEVEVEEEAEEEPKPKKKKAKKGKKKKGSEEDLEELDISDI